MQGERRAASSTIDHLVAEVHEHALLTLDHRQKRLRYAAICPLGESYCFHIGVRLFAIQFVRRLYRRGWLERGTFVSAALVTLGLEPPGAEKPGVACKCKRRRAFLFCGLVAETA